MRFIAGLACVLLCACGGGNSNPSGPSNPGTPPGPNTITIGANGAVSPAELVVAPGTRVLFINNHNRRHNMTSDPHPEHDQCDPINTVGLLNPGQRRETGNLVTVRSCGYHDHDEFENNALKGRIVVR